jgi:hypothetical protein
LGFVTALLENISCFIDESGDGYLYPMIFFRSTALPQTIKKAVLAAA